MDDVFVLFYANGTGTCTMGYVTTTRDAENWVSRMIKRTDDNGYGWSRCSYQWLPEEDVEKDMAHYPIKTLERRLTNIEEKLREI